MADSNGPLVWSHTIFPGAGRILVVGISIAGDVQVSGTVTYAGVNMTQAGARNGPGNQNRVEMWYLMNPPVGTGNIVANLTASTNVVGGAASFTGVAASAPAFSSDSGTGTTASNGNLLGSLGSTLVVDTLVAQGSADPAAPDPSQTQRWYARTGGGAGNVLGAGSTEPGQLLLPSDSWSLSSSSPWALASVTLSPC